MQIKPIDYTTSTLFKYIKEEEVDMNSTVPENYLRAVKMYSSCKFMGYRTGLACNVKQTIDSYQFITYEESMQYVAQITQQLLAKGLMKGDRVVIYAKNSPLWLLSDIAIQFAGGVSVPIYDTLGIDNIIYCCNLTEAAFILVSTDYLANIVGNVSKLEHIKTIFAMEQFDQELLIQQTAKIVAQLKDNGYIKDDASLYSIRSSVSQEQVEITQQLVTDVEDIKKQIIQYQTNNLLCNLSFKKLNDCKQYLYDRIIQINLNCKDINSVIFTSGTSGKPKGVVVSHQNLLSALPCAVKQTIPNHIGKNGQQSSVLSYLPLAHMYERSAEHGILTKGYLIYYSSGNIKNLTKDIQLSTPSVFLGVPRIYCKIHQSIISKLNKSSLPLKLIFKISYNLKKKYLFSNQKHFENPVFVTDFAFKSIRNALGNPEVVFSGSAALPLKVKEFLEVTSGAKLIIGWTMTETGGSGLVNTPGQKYNDQNQIGRLGAFTEGKIVDRSDKCEFTLEDNVGELKVKGPGIAKGYIDGKWGKIQPIVDSEGFFSTGDLVRVYPDGTASFIRRVGLVVKLQHGEFVDLEAIEAALEGSPVIMQAFAHGEPDKTAPVCFVSLDSNILRQKLGEEIVNRFKANDAAAINQIEQFVCKEGDEIIRKAGLKGFNVPKAYKVLLDVDWSQNQDFYTPSQKKKHGPFIKAHQSQLKQLWELVEQRENKVVPKKSNMKLIALLGFVLFVFALLMMK
ncbi:Long_chain fatty acid CoA ligase [Hexamita inflata]|uniref:Long chain fatty acid CoA ligase n=1 Tax=Hexamita inflata TaxID=28002 RepID=A0AA86P6Y8_9EUKA|nr:Long chain fatty acid CoA ligase [Hexamita inflata]